MSATVPPFVTWFRAAAPYIHAFRGKTFVVAFGGEVVDEGQLVHLSHDVALLASLGVRLVLIHGVRPQLDALIAKYGLTPQYANGLRVTDPATMGCVKQANGIVRIEIEALLSTGLPNTPMANAAVNVASGNFIVASPRGVFDGVDLQYTGAVRKVDVPALRGRLDAGEIVLVSPLGYSPTGEAFNLTVEDVATSVATALSAEKLIFMIDGPGVQRGRGRLLRELTLTSAEAWFDRMKVSTGGLASDIARFLPAAIDACRRGVARAHLVSRHVDGALLLELFTHHGIGTMISRDALERLRPARIDDVGAVLQLIAPLEAEGTLVKRGRERIEREIGYFTVVDHDRRLIGCAALYPFPAARSAELACLVVHPDHRDAGHGEALLLHIEARARAQKLDWLFALTTHTAHWFIENGFHEVGVSELPAERRELYNWQRRSKVFVKAL
ncbi:MAG: amino-acid N-acetyltransferase [Proteobacteria bacterium]|nr:amino-acid N-acetyltransferase [Burkholderiales bacterium]